MAASYRACLDQGGGGRFALDLAVAMGLPLIQVVCGQASAGVPASVGAASVGDYNSRNFISDV
jgi:hypothetical protein